MQDARTHSQDSATLPMPPLRTFSDSRQDVFRAHQAISAVASVPVSDGPKKASTSSGNFNCRCENSS